MRNPITVFKEWKKEREYQKKLAIEEKKFEAYKEEANRLHRISGKRYFVVPKSETECIVVDNVYIKAYNRQKGVRKINIHDLIKMAYYATPARGLTA